MFKVIDFNPRDLIQKYEDIARFLIPQSEDSTDKYLSAFEEAIRVFYQEVTPRAALLILETKSDSKGLYDNRQNLLFPYQHPLFKKSSWVCFTISTLGPMIDRWINELFLAKEYSLSNVLEAIGLEALERIGENLRLIFREELAAGNNLSFTLSPGCQGLPLESMSHMYTLLKGYKIGIQLNESNLLTPLKSVAGIMLAGKDMPVFNENQCLYCAQQKECSYRKNP